MDGSPDEEEAVAVRRAQLTHHPFIGGSPDDEYFRQKEKHFGSLKETAGGILLSKDRDGFRA